METEAFYNDTEVDMDSLDRAREEIRAADREMAALFRKRMQAVREIAAYKKEHGIPVYDGQQEKRVVERNLSLVPDPELRGYYLQFLEDTMAVSKRYQRDLNEGIRVAYSGIEGAFAHTAARRLFPEGKPVPFASFDAAYGAVVSGDCACAVLPIENSYAGEVGQVMDLMFRGSLYVNGVYDLTVSQNLLGRPEAVLSGIRKVISHPQALGQCAEYIRRHGFEEIICYNTAEAARQVAEGTDPSLAAIAAAETAEIYGLRILEKDINESRFNTTRFAVFSRVETYDAQDRDAGTFLMMFTVGHVAGALARAVNVIGKYGFNMRILRSRPMKDLPWQYYFYAEAEGDERSENGRKMLEELAGQCEMLKVVGRYAAPGGTEEERS